MFKVVKGVEARHSVLSVNDEGCHQLWRREGTSVDMVNVQGRGRGGKMTQCVIALELSLNDTGCHRLRTR